MTDVVLGAVPALAGLYRNAALGAVRRRAGLPGTATGDASRRALPGTLPQARYRVDGAGVDRDRLTAFQHLVGQAARDAVPSAHVHTLAFPVAMSLMSRPDFPLPLLGMVHLSNTVVQTRALRADERFDVTAYAENLLPHRSGMSVEMVTEVTVEGQRIWTGRSVYLARGVGSSAGSSAGAAPAPEPRAVFVPPVPTARWNLGADAGRRYAAVSGDWNPIHLSGLAARALGMKRAVAHGMYLAARLVEQVEPTAPGAIEWGVDFVSPVLLPGSVFLSVRPAAPSEFPGGSRRSEATGWAPGASRPSFTGWVTRQAPPAGTGR